MSFVFFFLFALALLGSYIGIRRELASPLVTAGGGMLASIITMTLYLLARDTHVLQGVVMGVLIGGIISGATLAIAWYFHSSEIRARYYAAEQGYPAENLAPTDEYYE